MKNIFVYGTLRRGECRNHVLDEAEVLPGDWRVSARMHTLGAFPALVLDEDSVAIGEVYQVAEENVSNTLQVLDGIEGTAFGLYKRVEVVAVNDDGEEVKCLTYVAGPRMEDVNEYPVIESGDWKNIRLSEE